MKEVAQKKAAEGPKRNPDVRCLNGTLRSDSVAGQVAVLQRSIGNRAVERLFRSCVLLPKLRIGQPNDIFEQEADRVADEVMRMPEKAVSSQQTAISKGNESVIQMKPG